MIPLEVENLQSQLSGGEIEVDDFFAILLSSYELDLCQVYKFSWFSIKVHKSHNRSFLIYFQS